MTEPLVGMTERTRLRRLPDRGRYDRETIYGILDATSICHVGYVIDGKPAVTPTLHWREGDHLYWHGSAASRALRAADGANVCLTVSLLDGLVLARSAFHHSVNYRSVMVFGRATRIDDPEIKLARLRTFIELLYPGRWETLRPIHDRELKATMVLSMPIDEASAKVRTGDPVDDDEDYTVPVWAGIVPVRQAFGDPEADPRNLPEVSEPDCLRSLFQG